mmetsp:Transcript_38197/g.89633  ORF Transcript_38197/g.89633 Transcript_38197/m.89633 type:complete len:519 (-) Transcript_38197:277-1833(-)|eukprot:CAMPEP_0178410946 /NCGR_PEP_ID=MMETSP0689_2-20121128/21244_1 /TAXON_ID=160604 /ORGANISM="Amphidinium massartii, Strain CS-259" /LENGTH=518 /DNA_ID=CAMNT_0020032143 /DNA_START=76 /DNA_END=1632 /DNA_ORIENTATION=+
MTDAASMTQSLRAADSLAVNRSRSGIPAEPEVLKQEQSPAYKALHDAGLIVHSYRIESISELDVVPPNSTVGANLSQRCFAWVAGLGVGGVAYECLMKQFTVPAGCVRPARHKDGSYFFYGPGVHKVVGVFVALERDVPLTQPVIFHGNRAIVTVPQGFIGLAFDRGQPVILAPGLHQWVSHTMSFKELIDLSTAVIRIGPFTLLTVDEGYAAVTQDNGKQMVLAGGHTHMLTHRNWKFEKFMSLKIHTDTLRAFRATSADNVVLETNATVNWRVRDPVLAARMAADTMAESGDGQVAAGTPMVKHDVLHQAIASLAAAIGGIRYADDVHIAASEKVSALESAMDSAIGATHEETGIAKIFNAQQMSSATCHANEICSQYGVEVLSINVVSAVPVDRSLEEALSAGAVAAAGAQQAELAARGNAKARLIGAQAEAEAMRISAQAHADAERVAAAGKRDAAKTLESSEVAVDLARLERAGQLLAEKSTFFFGSGPQQIPALLSNPKVVATDDNSDYSKN